MTMSAATEPRSAWPLTRGETAVFGVFLVAACVAVPVTFRTPIPSGNTRYEEVALFLKQLYPDREVSGDFRRKKWIASAHVAVVLHLIRSGEPAIARRAIDFA